jgi:hypothetical protein
MQGEMAKKVTRRKFLATGAAAATSQALASLSSDGPSNVPLTSPEVGAWLLIRPKYQLLAPTIGATAAEQMVSALALYLATDFPPEPAARSAREWFGFFTADPGDCSNGFAGWGGSTARTLLLEWSTRLWSVPRPDLAVEQGVITRPASSSATYGRIAAAASDRFEHFFWANHGDEEFPMELLICERRRPFVAFGISCGAA